jgi:hypothetical protein
VASLNKICRTSQEWGTEFSDFNRALKRLGLKREKIADMKQLDKALKRKKPVVSAFIDEEGGGHYAIIKGWRQNSSGEVELIFHDSYFGPNFTRKRTAFKRQLRAFGSWMYAISPSH